MSLFVQGLGAVSSAGWGVPNLLKNLLSGVTPETLPMGKNGVEHPCLPVPKKPSTLTYLNHPRLRRASPLSLYGAAASAEALGITAGLTAPSAHLGVICCVTSGCVNYTARFFEETLRDPSQASPLLFPETVFNAPASHIAALLQITGPNYTLVGDAGTFAQALALAGYWLEEDKLQGCLVIGAEELDWLNAEALSLTHPNRKLSAGAGALFLAKNQEKSLAKIEKITDSFNYSNYSRSDACQGVRRQLEPTGDDSVLLSLSGEAFEMQAWRDCPGLKLIPRLFLGESLAASGALQVVSSIAAMQPLHKTKAFVSIAGLNEQAIGCLFSTA